MPTQALYPIPERPNLSGTGEPLDPVLKDGGSACGSASRGGAQAGQEQI
jgi:hypothetical protein